MAARVITITSGKGGVGKTTATANLGVALASLGNRVVCLDADIGLRNLDVVMGLENRIVYNIVDVVEGRAKLRQAMIKDKRLKDELYLIPAAQTRDKTAVSPSDMIRICDELRPLVDFIIVDSPAGIERGFRNAVAPADEVLIVTNPEVSSIRDADRIIGLIEAEGKGPGSLIINRIKSDMVKRGDMLSPEDVIDILAIKLIGLIPEDEAILVSSNRGLPVTMKFEESRAGQAFMNIGRRLMGEEVPFMPLEEETGLFKKLFGKRKKDSAPAPRKRKAESPAVSVSTSSEPDALTKMAEAERKAAAAAAAPLPTMPTASAVAPNPPAPDPTPAPSPSPASAAPAAPVAEPAKPAPAAEPKSILKPVMPVTKETKPSPAASPGNPEPVPANPGNPLPAKPAAPVQTVRSATAGNPGNTVKPAAAAGETKDADKKDAE